MIEHGSRAAPAAAGRNRLRFFLILVAGAAALGVAIGAVAVLLTRPSSSSTAVQGGPAATWAPGDKRAPGFSLTDQRGKPVSLAALRGRTTIVTFIDPLCRDFCPLEAKVLTRAIDELPADRRPAIVAVSVNRWGNARRNLLQDVKRWHLPPEWRWGVGAPATLERVWRDYKIGVQAVPKTIAGVTVHQIAHTEGAYVVDGSGHWRALFLWPYTADDLLGTLRDLDG